LKIFKTIYSKKHWISEHIRKADTWDEFKDILENKRGFILAHWDGTPETEQKIKEETKATIRLIPVDGEMEEGKCIYSGKPSKQRVVFALSY
jgi:prolyl-tRNA synthetase